MLQSVLTHRKFNCTFDDEEAVHARVDIFNLQLLVLVEHFYTGVLRLHDEVLDEVGEPFHHLKLRDPLALTAALDRVSASLQPAGGGTACPRH